VGWLPFENVLTCAWVVGRSFNGKDEAIILVLKFVHHVIKDGVCIPDVEHFLHEQVNLGRAISLGVNRNLALLLQDAGN
jgi:hypothetical protein